MNLQGFVGDYVTGKEVKISQPGKSDLVLQVSESRFERDGSLVIYCQNGTYVRFSRPWELEFAVRLAEGKKDKKAF